MERLGVGVGDASASPTAALLLSVLQESMGRIATILFAHRLGTSLEPECKMYRLAADVLNDAAMVLDCLSPAFPKAIRVPILSFSSVLRSLCGVCAGSSKASLSAHFAKRGNLGELNAVSCILSMLYFRLMRHSPWPDVLHINTCPLSSVPHSGPRPHVQRSLPRLRDKISSTLIAVIPAEGLEPGNRNIAAGHAGECYPEKL